MKVVIGNKEFKVKSLFSDKGRKKGLKGFKTLPEGKGIALRYKTPSVVTITMDDVYMDLAIIFILNEEIMAISIGVADGGDILYDGSVDTIIEINSDELDGILVGHKIEWVGEKLDGGKIKSGQDLSKYKSEDLLILDENGNVQGKMKGLDRVHSRADTKVLYDLCVQADSSKSDTDYKKVGRALVRIITKQDSTPTETIDA